MAPAAPKSTAIWVVKRLRAAGFEALLAGGCVRDMLLNRPCTDYDVATSARPEDVKRLFHRVLLVGAKFGVAIVIRDHLRVEVATFRSDLSYVDGRRPEGVVFTTAKEDALRRDFTINGMFYDPVAEKVIDYVGGRNDLRRGVVRTIGSPRRRFGEDYLRMLRAPRFAVGLGFQLDSAAARAIRSLAYRIEDISGERIVDELAKMLARPSAADALRMLEDLGLAHHVLPELFTEPGVWAGAVERVSAVARRGDLVLTFGALLGDLPEDRIAKSVRRGGQSNQMKDSLTWLGEHLGDWRRTPDMSLAEFKRLLAVADFPRLARLWAFEERKATGRATLTRRAARRARSIAPENVAPQPLVFGRHLKGLGLKESPLMGLLLRRLYEAQLNEEVSDRREAMKLAVRLLRERAFDGAPEKAGP